MEKYSWIKEYKFFKKLCELTFVDEIWLYGSRARGDNQERSDIDFAIVCPRATRWEWLTLKDVIDEGDILFKIDCVRLDSLGEESEFRKNILRDHVVLYQRGEKHV